VSKNQEVWEHKNNSSISINKPVEIPLDTIGEGTTMQNYSMTSTARNFF
jgi:hypothetical protein